jgi:hypothetical protein
MVEPILMAQHDETQCLLYPDKVNRHGLITGAANRGALSSILGVKR